MIAQARAASGYLSGISCTNLSISVDFSGIPILRTKLNLNEGMN